MGLLVKTCIQQTPANNQTLFVDRSQFRCAHPYVESGQNYQMADTLTLQCISTAQHASTSKTIQTG